MAASQAEERGLKSIPTAKRVRARIGPTIVAESTRSKMVYWDHHPIWYAFPRADVKKGLLTGLGAPEVDDLFGTVRRSDATIGGKHVKGVAVAFESGPAVERGLEDYVAIPWDSADAWYEEAEEVFVHPRDPHKRIDVLHTDRHIVIRRDGVELANTTRAVMLIENPGFLPVRYYIRPDDVHEELLVASETRSQCPYKGEAEYHHVDIEGTRHPDLVWRYRVALPEVAKMQGLYCFFNERVDVLVDGVVEDTPWTPWGEEPTS